MPVYTTTNPQPKYQLIFLFHIRLTHPSLMTDWPTSIMMPLRRELQFMNVKTRDSRGIPMMKSHSIRK